MIQLIYTHISKSARVQCCTFFFSLSVLETKKKRIYMEKEKLLNHSPRHANLDGEEVKWKNIQICCIQSAAGTSPEIGLLFNFEGFLSPLNRFFGSQGQILNTIVYYLNVVPYLEEHWKCYLFSLISAVISPSCPLYSDLHFCSSK